MHRQPQFSIISYKSIPLESLGWKDGSQGVGMSENESVGTAKENQLPA